VTKNTFWASAFAFGVIAIGIEGLITGDVFAFGGKGSSGAILDRDEQTGGFWSFVIFYFLFGAFILWNVIKNERQNRENSRR
jgi:hypothetical protein